MVKILVIEDDKELASEVKEKLTREGHVVELAYDGATAKEFFRTISIDLIVLDIDLPDTSGISICRELRDGGVKTPVLMLTGRSSIDDKERALDIGADDYLTKPFNERELSARIRALLRRPVLTEDNLFKVRDLTLNTTTKQVFRDGVVVKILPKEYALLEFLLRHKSQVFNADNLLDRVWSSEDVSSPEAVRQCIKRLRDKIDLKGQDSYITTVAGFGYTIEKNE